MKKKPNPISAFEVDSRMVKDKNDYAMQQPHFCCSLGCCQVCVIFSGIAVVFLLLLGLIVQFQPQFVPEIDENAQEKHEDVSTAIFIASGTYFVFAVLAGMKVSSLRSFQKRFVPSYDDRERLPSQGDDSFHSTSRNNHKVVVTEAKEVGESRLDALREEAEI